MNEENDILISRYLATDLPPPALAAFEARLAAEPELAAELQRRKEELTFLKSEAALPALETQMATLAEQHFLVESEDKTPQAGPQVPAQDVKEQGQKEGKTAKVRSLNWKRWAPAAGIAAAVALVLLLWNPFSTGEPYQQFAQYVPLNLTEKSSDNLEAATSAQQAFNAKNYEEAHTQLIKYLQQNPDDNEARLAFGIAALETNRDAEARAIFTELANGTTAFKDDGQFYLGLAYFKAGDARAKTELGKISPDNPDFGVRVREILQLMQE
jgi:hypothetical protein